MCDGGMTAVAVASLIIGTYAAHENAEAQSDMLQMQADQQQKEIDSAATEESGRRTLDGARERARIRVAAGESGLTGQSFELNLLDSLFQQQRDNGNTEWNRKNGISASSIRASAAAAQNQAQLNQTYVSAVNSGLQIYDDYQTRNPSTTPKGTG